MKQLIIIIWILFTFTTLAQQPLIIDHTCIDLSEIPINWIDSAKLKLFIGYGHTSHGSQLASGMDAIESFFSEGKYNWSHTGENGELHLFEGSGYDPGYLAQDCGYAGWDTETREFLRDFPNCNVIIWSWCGQVNDVNLTNHYLNPMAALEAEYPNVTFVYMTGHLEGLGPNGSLFQANQQIRNYCKTNNKVLFDFTDIEKYDPDANVNYQQYYVTDGCDYLNPSGGSANWANDWLAAHPDDTLSLISKQCNSCAHSVSLNCVKKGIAAWHLWARIAGWEGNLSGLEVNKGNNQLVVYPNPLKDFLNLKLPDHGKEIQITLTTIQGKVIHILNTETNSKEISLPISDLIKGVYILQVKTNNKIYLKKIIR